MSLLSVEVSHFRSIKSGRFCLSPLSLFVGDNGTGKTSYLEAIHMALSPRLSSSRIKHTDFFEGSDNPIRIKLTFDSPFVALLPDGFATQRIDCNHVWLEIKKRDRAAGGKAFSEEVVITHHVLPNRPKDTDKGWAHPRRSREKKFEFDERLLSFPQVSLEGFPRCFYFAKDRGKQLKPGFNSSISSVFDDFNWRFSREMRKHSALPDFITKKNAVEDEIRKQIDADAVKKTFDALNRKLTHFGLPAIAVSFIDGHAPYDNAFLTRSVAQLDLPIANTGSGEEMISAMLFLETLAELSKEALVLIIDEPELHLHPRLQQSFAGHLLDSSSQSQTLLSTHSPYFFQRLLRQTQVELLVTDRESDGCIIRNTGNGFGVLPWSPSWGEVNYHAYGLPTAEFHDELYGWLHEQFIGDAKSEADAVKRGSQKEFDKHLKSSVTGAEVRQWTAERGGIALEVADVTLQTFIRNKMHHPENNTMQDKTFSADDLKCSIEQMLELISKRDGAENESPTNEEPVSSNGNTIHV